MSFVAELKQRKVFRVATVYIVVAWATIQVADIVLPTFDAPIWVLRTLIFLIALGFPMALLLSWALELTPEGLKRTASNVGNRRMAWLAAGLAAVALGWFVYGQSGQRALISGETAGAQDRSIAVLPLVNMSGNKDNDYFSDGLAETVLDMLARVPNLKVIARTSSFAFKDKAMDVREIGKALNAAHLLEGSVQQAGDQVRITMQLIRTGDGAHLWSQQYDRKLADVFRIQDEVAVSVVKALQLALPDATQKHLTARRTEDVAAYREYLKGNALLPKRKVGELREALAHFERAIEIDPLYAQAYVGAANSLVLLSSHAGLTREERARRDDLVRQALELDPEMGEAYIARAAIQQGEDDDAAERDYLRGLELSPSYATGLQWYGEFLAYTRLQPAKAVPLYERAIAVDPLAPIIRAELGRALMLLGRVNESEAIANRIIAESPDSPIGYALRITVQEHQGDLVGALRTADQLAVVDPAGRRASSERCNLLLSFGALQPAKDCLQALADRNEFPRGVGSGLFEIALANGDIAEARAVFESQEEPLPWLEPSLLVAEGKPEAAVEKLRQFLPGLFEQPVGDAGVTSPYDYVDVGDALLGIGETRQAEAVLNAGLQKLSVLPYGSAFGRGWSEVIINAMLGRDKEACAALSASFEHGYFQNGHELAKDSDLDSLRKQECFIATLDKIQKKAEAQVQAAQEAGLLKTQP